MNGANVFFPGRTKVQPVRRVRQLSLEPDASAPGSARRFTVRILQGWQCHQMVETAELLVSELVTNAVKHAGTKIELRVSLRRRAIRFDIIDLSPSQALPGNPEAGSLSGRGLRIVGSLALEWGTSALDQGKSVWFTVPRSSADRAIERV
ncbi:MAG: hypothetical protein NVSMB57_14590 [Actinomycetota bacterium]